MADWKMIDADGHIREVESDVFEYLPDYYKARREAVLYFPLLPHHGWHRQAGRGGMGASFLIPTLEDWRAALEQSSRNARKYLRLVSRNDCLNSLYNDPPERVIWMVPARLALYFRMRSGWKIHDPGGAWWVVREVVRCLPRVWRDRRPVSRKTLKRWRALRQQPERYEVRHAG